MIYLCIKYAMVSFLNLIEYFRKSYSTFHYKEIMFAHKKVNECFLYGYSHYSEVCL